MNHGGSTQDLKTQNAFVPVNPFLTTTGCYLPSVWDKLLRTNEDCSGSDVVWNFHQKPDPMTSTSTIITWSAPQKMKFQISTSCLMAYHHVLRLMSPYDSAFSSLILRNSGPLPCPSLAFSNCFQSINYLQVALRAVIYMIQICQQHCTLTHYINKHKFHMVPFLPRGPFWRRPYLEGPSLRVRAEP